LAGLKTVTLPAASFAAVALKKKAVFVRHLEMIGYFHRNRSMPTASTAQKLKIKESSVICKLHAPKEYTEALGQLPAGCRFSKRIEGADQVHWFVKNRVSMEAELEKIISAIRGKTICWIFYPKGSSGMQTDLTRDAGWDKLLQKDMQWISLVSFNDQWSAFGMREKTEADGKKKREQPERAILQYIDTEKRLVRLPEDLEKALEKRPAEKAFFESLSFTNKKEYVEWVVSAKKEETRSQRVKETVIRLGKNWKNPANR